MASTVVFQGLICVSHQAQVVAGYAKIHLAVDDMMVAAGAGPATGGAGAGFIDVLNPVRLAAMAALK